MKSNGFGSWKQRIIVSVEKEQASQVAARFGFLPLREAEEPSRAYFAWTRFSQRRGDDEGVILDLSKLLGSSKEANWEVDWCASEL